MAHDDGEIASLRLALASAEQARDDALDTAAAIRQRWHDERREEQHRLRNLFSVVRAIARRTGDDAETVEDYCGSLDGRLSAYLNIQVAMMRDWSEGADLALLLAESLHAFGLREGEQAVIEGPAVRLTSQAAGILALIFHELAVEAIASDKRENGHHGLRVVWRVDAEPSPALVIDWTERAVSGDRGAWQSSWADWVEQAVRYQLAGTLVTEATDAARATRISLSAASMCR